MSEINPLQTSLAGLLNSEPIRTAADGIPGKDEEFANILKEAFDTTTVTDRTDKANTMQLLMGESDDLSGMLIDMQKAELSLQLALQIRNKLVDAYQEVMRMSV